MFDFDKYDDVMLMKDYDGFIDRYGNFYRVIKRGEKITDENGKIRDSHNVWAQKFIKEKLNVKDFKFNPTTSALFTLTTLNGPAEILINCYGYVYYSHDPLYRKPIIKIPNPKIANYKVTEEQLDTLYSIMVLNRENTNIDILFGEEDIYDYYGMNDQKNYRKI